ncbi:MAG: PGN_0703 family putative restriction endonuclease [Ignavibacterium sp.]
MNYRETERQKALRIRDELFKDPGNGEHLKVKYPFVLFDVEKNLWTKIRKEAIKYFAVNKIVWWPSSTEPSGHLLSSQVSCVNHLFFLRNDKDAALRILQNLNPDFVEVCPDFENSYIGFEVVSKHSYLGEVAFGKEQTRGANCTSVDAMMTGKLKNGKKIQVLIEWKYTELDSKSDKSEGSSGATRKNRYDALIDDKESPIKRSISIDNFYYEPFYQIMRQTLLAWQMTKNKADELKTDDWLHLDIIPENNLNLRYQVPAPDMVQSGIEEAWKTQLKEPEKYNVITPQKLLKPIIFEAKFRSLVNYLNYRYW